MDESMRFKTSGWHNNCGLNCLTHFLVGKLKTGDVQQTFADNPSYQSLLTTFQEYYELPNVPTWNELNTLFNTLNVPTDYEAIFGPVLRLQLGKLLQVDPEDLWIRLASEAFCEYINTGKAEDSAQTIYNSNKDWFDQHRLLYLIKHKEDQAKFITSEEIALVRAHFESCTPPKDTSIENLCTHVLFKREQDLLTQFQEEGKTMWLNTGCESYAKYMGQLSNDALVSADQLQLLAKYLSIGVEISTSTGDLILPEDGFHWVLRVHNSGLHWTFYPFELFHTVIADSIQKHNLCYPSSFQEDEFLNNESLSGKFKIYVPEVSYKEGIIESIKAYVCEHFEKMALALQPTSESPAVLFQAPLATRKHEASIDVEQLENEAKVDPSKKPRT